MIFTLYTWLGNCITSMITLKLTHRFTFHFHSKVRNISWRSKYCNVEFITIFTLLLYFIIYSKVEITNSPMSLYRFNAIIIFKIYHNINTFLILIKYLLNLGTEVPRTFHHPGTTSKSKLNRNVTCLKNIKP